MTFSFLGGRLRKVTCGNWFRESRDTRKKRRKVGRSHRGRVLNDRGVGLGFERADWEHARRGEKLAAVVLSFFLAVLCFSHRGHKDLLSLQFQLSFFLAVLSFSHCGQKDLLSLQPQLSFFLLFCVSVGLGFERADWNTRKKRGKLAAGIAGDF